MFVLAIIPARAGSRGVPGKNLKRVGGRSLLSRAIVTAQSVDAINEVAVSSDGQAILDAAAEQGAVPLRRPDDIAGDTASSESALRDAITQWEAAGRPRPDVVVFVQCTSPFIDPAAVARAVDRVGSGSADVVFSAVPSHGFLWKHAEDGAAIGVNHDSSVRLRRQERMPEFLETGAFYVMRSDGFRKGGHRFFGRVEMELVDIRSAIEVDDPVDLELAQVLAMTSSATANWPVIDDLDAVVMDFDGVHTDNTAFVDQHAVESVRVNRSDGLGLAMLRSHDVATLILSTERNPVVLQRADKLEIDCIAGCDDKIAALREWVEHRGFVAERIAYVGNDVNDRACLEWVGWPIVVADAHPDVLSLARCRTSRVGGRGAVRELVDLLLRTQTTRSDQEVST